MKSYILLVLGVILCLSCAKNDEEPESAVYEPPEGTGNFTAGCQGTSYDNWETSQYVLPYPVGETYMVHLSHCSGSYHSKGEPDQFAVDFAMPISSIITASRAGEVVFVEERGIDGEFPNNVVVVKHQDNTYGQYMHLTRNGAIAEVGDLVTQGDTIGKSGATGLAGYPHLHFVLTKDSWEYPYVSTHYNYKNTTANPYGPESRKEYTALRYQ
ncbi:M23 family metallopeptidase [Rasiella rasia]|uniref:M23 family metallopeptidase n=1 Tax=Rasiella rasia TaxID=2744027 RepID=A0A6G6GQI9_9FLAO|nr:M23 family metallopeptidase [Rasiella rasia]QIE60734.1 M23 family metallopeptidase [Rasiella rasia]